MTSIPKKHHPWRQYTEPLPTLPRKLKKREADITPRILAWFRENHEASCAIEIKATDTRSIPESALAPHQRAALLQAKKGTLVHKISDAGRMRVPFDAFMLTIVPAYVVAAFTGKERTALVFHVEDWRGATPESRCAWRINL